METEEDNYYDIEKWLCLDKELSYCLNYVPYNNNIKYHKDSANCSIFYIPINKIITK